MRIIGLALVIVAVAGFLVLRDPAFRWESVGVGVTGVVLLLIRERPR